MARDEHISSSVEVEARLPFQSLDVYVAARELAAVVHQARIANPELRDQATRAAKSVFLNLCEGLPSDSGPMRRKPSRSPTAPSTSSWARSTLPAPSARWPPRRQRGRRGSRCA